MPIRSLADDLRGRDDAALARLLIARPDLMHPVPADMTALAARAGSSTSTTRALDGLDRFTLRVAGVVAALPEPCTRTDVLNAFPGPARDAAADALGHLRDLALVWGSDDDLRVVRTARDGLGPVTATVPDVAFPPEPIPEGKARATELIDRTAAQHALLVTTAVSTLLDAWQGDAAPGVLRKGGLSARDLAATARLLDTDEVTAALFIEVAYAAGLLARDGEVDERWLPTPEYDDWREDAPVQQWALLGRTWLTMRRTPSMVGDGVHALSEEAFRPGHAAVRMATLRTLALLPEGCPPSAPPDIARALDERLPRAASKQRDEAVVAILREAEILGFTGLGALAAAGRAAIAESDLGAAIAAAMPQPLDHVLIQADLTAVAPGPLRSDLDRELRLMADLESTGGATVFRFTRSSIGRALDSGRAPDDLLQWLASTSRTPLPQPLGYLVEDVARQHGVVRVGLADAYIRCDDEATLAAILADRRAAALRPQRVGPGVVVAHGSPEKIIATLKELGLHPVAEASDGSVVLPRASMRRAPRQHVPREGTGRTSRATLTKAIAALRASG